MIYFIFLALASFCNACMDTLQFHFHGSIFSKLPYKYIYWFNPSVSWKNKYIDRDPSKPIKKIFFGLMDRPFTDAWHTFKSLMVLFVILTCISYPDLELHIVVWLYHIALSALVWNLTFNFFYNDTLMKKNG